MALILLKDMVEQEGQVQVAKRIGCHQTAISLAVRKNRVIHLEIEDGKVTSGYEIKPAFGLPFKNEDTLSIESLSTAKNK